MQRSPSRKRHSHRSAPAETGGVKTALTQLPADLAKLVQLSLLAPGIAEEIGGNSNTTDYLYGRMMRLLASSGAIDAAFARGFALQIERACRSVGRRQDHKTDALRSGLAIVVQHAPQEVWAVLAGFYETGTRAERQRLDAIIAPTRPFAWDVSRVGPGALFATPLGTMLDWADEDQNARSPFLVSFFPTVEQRESTWSWHPALQALADRYGASKGFRDALRRRILPNAWSGSLDPHLTSYREPLESWTSHSLLGHWASSTLEAVNRWIHDESLQS